MTFKFGFTLFLDKGVPSSDKQVFFYNYPCVTSEVALVSKRRLRKG